MSEEDNIFFIHKAVITLYFDNRQGVMGKSQDKEILGVVSMSSLYRLTPPSLLKTQLIIETSGPDTVQLITVPSSPPFHLLAS